MRFRQFAVLAFAAVAVSGCGSTDGQPRTAEALEPAPPIEAIDEGMPELWPAAEMAYDIALPPEDSDFTTEDPSPASGTVPRAIARLKPSRDSAPTARVVVWRTESGSLCVEPEAKETGVWTRAGITGPCSNHCDQICVEQIWLGERPFERSVLAGIVAADADELLIALENGQSRRFPLTAPLVPGFHDWRVFMVDLGDGLYEELELRRRGKRIASVAKPPAQLAGAVCFRNEIRSAPKRTVKEIAKICARLATEVE